MGSRFNTGFVPLSGWLLEVNNVSERGATLCTELGSIVPNKLRDKAHKWFWSLPFDYRRDAQRNWGTLRAVISAYWMSTSWLNRQKSRANKAAYRDEEHTQ